MINKIDIQKAASSKHNPAFGVSGYLAARTAFAAGVEWFKKALWHDVSEMPEKGKAFIFLAESNSSKHYHVGVVYNPMVKASLHSILFFLFVNHILSIFVDNVVNRLHVFVGNFMIKTTHAQKYACLR